MVVLVIVFKFKKSSQESLPIERAQLTDSENHKKSETEQFRDQTQHRFNKQLFVITMFYVFASIIDWVYLLVGR